jgi:hypothetical protein
MLRRLILVFFLAWSAFAFLTELEEALAGFDRREVARLDPILWRSGTPQVRILEQCLAEARPLIPPGSVVAFASPPGPGGADFYRWRWAAYLLPEDDVIPLSEPRAGELAQYLIAHRQPVEHPRLELIRALTGCRLYRVKAS